MAEVQPIPARSTPPLDSQAQDSLSGTVVGRFRIAERLGQGGMGEVYRAEDTKLKRTVALKRLAPALRADSLYRRRFLEEAERASRFGDAQVAAVYDVLEERGEIFLVLEYVEGQNLRQRLRQPLALEEFFTIAMQCAEALVSAHGHGIVHCDIKPENIMLTSAGKIKILDFGVAKHLPRSDQSSTVDRAGTFAGTPAYMSPEVLLERVPDGRADIFSLGVVFYEVLTGQHPFLANSFVATSDRIRAETPASIRIFNRSVSRELELVVNKAMAKDAERRYSSAEELLKALREVHGGLTSSGLARPVPLPQPHPQRKKWLWAAGVAAALLLSVLPYLHYRVRPPAILSKSSVPVQLAVLPFAPTTNDPSSKAFGDGLTETLTAKLAQLSGNYPLQVVATSEIRAEGVTSVEQARKNFGVGLVLEGNLHSSGNQVRVNYSLVDAETNRQLSADTVDADVSDAFAVEDQVVNGVLHMLGLSIQSNERVVLAAHGTGDPTAYDQYLRGRGYLLDYHKHENIENAISAFNRALTLDPKYGQAYAGLGKAYWLGYGEGLGGSEWLEKARAACDQAVAGSPKLADGYACLGSVYRDRGEYEKAIVQFERAAALDPVNDDTFRGLAEVYRKLNRPAEAEATYQKAIALRPQYWAGYSWLGAFYREEGRYEDAARMFQEVVTLAPDNFRGYSNLGAMYVVQGKYPQAIALLEKSIAIRPTVEVYDNLGTAYFYMRKFDGAAANYEEGLKFDKTSWLSWGNLGDAYSQVPGKRDKAVEAYREAIRLTDEELRVNPRDGRIWSFKAEYLAMTENKADALAALQKAAAFAPDNAGVLFNGALVHNHFGETTPTIKWLQRALAAGLPLNVINSTPDLDHLHSNPAFQAILRGTKV